MANPQTNNVNDEDFWVNGQASCGIPTTVLLDTGSEKYWINGEPAEDIFPKGNNATGKFFLIFEG